MSVRPSADVAPELAPGAAAPVDAAPRDDKAALIAASEGHNLLWLEIHQVFFRIAWIFKTESVVMPAFLNAVGGSAWMRGCLPILSRAGQSVPPLLYAATLRDLPYKKISLLSTTLLMGIPFLILAILWWTVVDPAAPPSWLPWVFLGLYFLFFSTTGLNQLASGTVIGKLVQADHRGGLMAISGGLGTIGASAMAWWLLAPWLSLPDQGFGQIFLFTAGGFVVAALLVLPVIEPPDDPEATPASWTGRLLQSWDLLCTRPDFRTTVLVGMVFTTAQFVFPHYETLGRTTMGEDAAPADSGWHLMFWIVVQNLGVGLFSYVLGTLADAQGNRLVLRITIFGVALTPLVALGLASGWFGPARDVYWITFALLGLLPVSLRTLQNYTLELGPPSEHPRYVSTLSLCQALPLVLSPLIGWAVDALGFAAVLIATSLLMAVGGGLTLFLVEPRESPDRFAGTTLEENPAPVE